MPRSESQENQPVKIFLSYASEDEDIMIAASQALDRLKLLSTGNIRIVYDKKSLEVGDPVPLISDISDKLLEFDYLVILYTGSLKKSFSSDWGPSSGFFWGFMTILRRNDGGSSNRKIVAIYFDDKLRGLPGCIGHTS